MISRIRRRDSAASPGMLVRGMPSHSGSSIGPSYCSGHTDGERRHVVHEEIGEVLGGDDDQRIGSRGDELARACRDRRRRTARATADRPYARAGDARRVAADTREHQAHTPATFSSNPVVMA